MSMPDPVVWRHSNVLWKWFPSIPWIVEARHGPPSWILTRRSLVPGAIQ